MRDEILTRGGLQTFGDLLHVVATRHRHLGAHDVILDAERRRDLDLTASQVQPDERRAGDRIVIEAFEQARRFLDAALLEPQVREHCERQRVAGALRTVRAPRERLGQHVVGSFPVA